MNVVYPNGMLMDFSGTAGQVRTAFHTETSAVHGIGITGWGETPYNVAVGGTDFGDSYLEANSTYWNSTNTKYYESAPSYIPEIPWNDTCASVLIASSFGYSKAYGNNGFCNSHWPVPMGISLARLAAVAVRAAVLPARRRLQE